MSRSIHRMSPRDNDTINSNTDTWYTTYRGNGTWHGQTHGMSQHHSYCIYCNVSNSSLQQMQQIIIFRLDDYSHCLITGCAVAQHCCKGDQPFQWEAAKFAPLYISNPLIFQHQIWHRQLRPPYLSKCKIWLESIHRGLLYDYVKYNGFVTFCTFPFLSFFSCHRLQQKRPNQF